MAARWRGRTARRTSSCSRAGTRTTAWRRRRRPSSACPPSRTTSARSLSSVRPEVACSCLWATRPPSAPASPTSSGSRAHSPRCRTPLTRLLARCARASPRAPACRRRRASLRRCCAAHPPAPLPPPAPRTPPCPPPTLCGCEVLSVRLSVCMPRCCCCSPSRRRPALSTARSARPAQPASRRRRGILLPSPSCSPRRPSSSSPGRLFSRAPRGLSRCGSADRQSSSRRVRWACSSSLRPSLSPPSSRCGLASPPPRTRSARTPPLPGAGTPSACRVSASLSPSRRCCRAWSARSARSGSRSTSAGRLAGRRSAGWRKPSARAGAPTPRRCPPWGASSRSRSPRCSSPAAASCCTACCRRLCCRGRRRFGGRSSAPSRPRRRARPTRRHRAHLQPHLPFSPDLSRSLRRRSVRRSGRWRCPSCSPQPLGRSSGGRAARAASIAMALLCVRGSARAASSACGRAT
mmetsp:Transcript_33207/g.99341  ORF Transcript_33207/g.99341 Transcript_33207/m.99341 type:complete len:464 (+) Transcript_33207:1175-2566(+)